MDISTDNNDIISSLTRYKKHKYFFIITSLLFSSSFTDETNVLFISRTGLNDANKALINGKFYQTLGVINLSEIYNLENIKGNSRWIDTVFSVWGMLNFSFLLVNDKAELISFPGSEQKIPVSNFKIQVIER